MNKQCHRIIFNHRRGQMMAVSDHATAQGKASSGATLAPRPGTVLSTFVGQSRNYFGTLALNLGLILVTTSTAFGQIIADKNAPANQRPTVLVDPAGRPLVNIQTPSAAGVSRNTYLQFDVPSSGAVLNNSRISNPWLATGSAKVILNEVNSSNPSYLRGAISVSGDTAQVVVANPSGITVNGASFSNASRVTLSTGTAVMSSGELTSLKVSGGTVQIEGAGLDTTGASYTDILSRVAIVTGSIKANDLALTTGTQDINYATGAVSLVSATGNTPTLAIDTSQLGGMYAGRITLLATEAGVGVRNAGTLQATGGQLIVTADGRLENSGTINAAVTSLATVKGNIDNSGALQSSQMLLLSSGADVNLQGAGLTQRLSTPSSVLMYAKRDVNFGIGSSVYSLGQGGQVSINAGANITLGGGVNVRAHGNVQLASDGQIRAQDFSNIVSNTGDVQAVAAQGISLDYASIRGNNVHLETGAAFKETNAPIAIRSSTLVAVDKITALSSGSLIAANSTLQRNGTAATGGAVTLVSAGDLELSNSAIYASDVAAGAGRIDIQTNANLTLKRSTLSANNAGKTSLSGAGISLIGSRIDALGTTATVDIVATQSGMAIDAARTASGALAAASTIRAAGAITLSTLGGDINLRGLQAQGESISVVATGNNAIGSAYFGETDINGSQQIATTALTAKSNITLASLQAGGALYLNGAKIQATAGDVWLSSVGRTDLSSVWDWRWAWVRHYGLLGSRLSWEVVRSNPSATTITAATHITANTGSLFS